MRKAWSGYVWSPTLFLPPPLFPFPSTYGCLLMCTNTSIYLISSSIHTNFGLPKFNRSFFYSSFSLFLSISLIHSFILVFRSFLFTFKITFRLVFWLKCICTLFSLLTTFPTNPHKHTHACNFSLYKKRLICYYTHYAHISINLKSSIQSFVRLLRGFDRIEPSQIKSSRVGVEVEVEVEHPNCSVIVYL